MSFASSSKKREFHVLKTRSFRVIFRRNGKTATEKQMPSTEITERAVALRSCSVPRHRRLPNGPTKTEPIFEIIRRLSLAASPQLSSLGVARRARITYEVMNFAVAGAAAQPVPHAKVPQPSMSRRGAAVLLPRPARNKASAPASLKPSSVAEA